MYFATSSAGDADLADEALRLRAARRLRDAELGLVREAHRLLVEAEHERGVTVALLGTRADHDARARLDHGDRDGLAVVREHLGHTEFFAEEAELQRHGERIYTGQTLESQPRVIR